MDVKAPVYLRVVNDLSSNIDEVKDDGSAVYKFKDKETADTYIQKAKLEQNHYETYQPPKDNVEFSFKTFGDFARKFNTQSEIGAQKAVQIDVSLNPMEFDDESHVMQHGITPRESAKDTVTKLLAMNSDTVDSTLADKLKPTLEKIATLAKGNTTAEVRKWIVEHASADSTPDTSALKSVLEHAEQTQHKASLGMLYSLARYEKAADSIASTLGEGIHDQKLTIDEARKLTLMADHILMQAYAPEAFSNSSKLLTTAPFFTVSQSADDFASHLKEYATNFNISGVIAKAYTGVNEQHICDEMTVKSPSENIRSIKTMWVKHAESKQTLDGIFSSNDMRTTQEPNFFGFGAKTKEISGDIHTKLTQATSADWIKGVDNMIAQKEGKSIASSDKNQQGAFEYYMNNQVLKAIEYSYDKPLAELSESELSSVGQSLKSAGYGEISAAVVKLAKYEAENGAVNNRNDKKVESDASSDVQQSDNKQKAADFFKTAEWEPGKNDLAVLKSFTEEFGDKSYEKLLDSMGVPNRIYSDLYEVDDGNENLSELLENNTFATKFLSLVYKQTS